MPPHTAAARARHARTATRRAPARRVSGPLRPVPAGAPVSRRGSTGVFERIRGLPDTPLIDGLLRGRAWIWLIGILLGGIVAMQVSLLKLNAGISRAATTASTLERQNADLEADIARLASGGRVRETAATEGMVTPPPGSIEFLRARPERDGRLAARRMQPPSDDAAAVMANGGLEPGVLAAPTLVTDPVVTDPVVTDPAVAAAPVETAITPAPEG